MSNMKIQEETEIPLNMEDLPNFKFKEQVDIPQPHDEYAIATKFVVELQNLLTKQKKDVNFKDEILNLYDSSFNKISDVVFKNSYWPSPHQLEDRDDNLEINLNTQIFYSELCYRHIYARLPNITSDIRCRSWENYKDLFDTIYMNKEDIPIPVAWIGDILDEFIYQFQANCQWRAKCKDDDANFMEIIEAEDDFWNLDKIQIILKQLVERSQILIQKDGKTCLDDFGGNLKTLHYFGYFALVTQLRLKILIGETDEALKIIQPIDFSKLSIYSKAYPCYIALFYYAGFGYLINGRYRETVKINVALLSFIQKYKQFYSKSFQYDAMNKQADRTLFLLAIALVFYPCTLDDTLQNLLKEKMGDKIERLEKYDINTFTEVFYFGTPKIIVPIKNFNHFKAMGFDKNPSEPTLIIRDKLLKEFQNIQNLNNISSLLKLYSKISIQKASVLLKKTTEEIKDLLNQYKQRNSSSLSDTLFESTILANGGSKQMDFLIENDIVTITENETSINYAKLFMKYSQKAEEMSNDLDMFDLNFRGIEKK